VYDSDAPRTPILTELRNLYRYRGLIRLLVAKDLTVRYRRSILGAGWTLLQPLLTTAVMWVIFSNVFHRDGREGVPFIVYLLSGVIVAHTFTQGVVAAGSAIVSSRPILTKMHVPPEVFSYTAALSAGAHFLISLALLLVAQLATGVGVPWTFLLVPIPLVCLLALVTGLGLIVAASAVRFYDVIPLTAVLAGLAAYLIPTFYPIDMIGPKFQVIIKANPLYSYLKVLRGFVYEGRFAEGWTFIVMGGSAALALALGVWIFSRSWKSMVVHL